MSTDTVPTDRPDDATAILRPEQPGNASSANMTTTTTDAAPPRRGYGALWAKVPREFGFLILTMPIAIIGLVVLSTVFFTGLGLVTIFVGIFLMVAAFYIARGFGTLELIRLRWAGRPEIRRPAWGRDGREQGFWRSAFAPFIDGHYWLYLLHTLVINPIVSVVTWSITIAWTSVAVAGTTGWIWQPFIPTGDRTFWLNEWLVDRFLPGNDLAYDPVVGERILEVLLGLVFLATLPFVFRGLTLLHDVIARGVLGAWRSEALEVEVAQLSASRGAAVQAEDASLRRLERDIHDGPQQRLVRLQMDLATIERRLEQDPDSAKALVGEAREQAREALDELRALSRGFAPPILQDRGLAAGLESLASRSPVPVIVEVDLADGALPAPIERNAYFIAAELLTNAAKHAQATAIRLRVGTRDEGPAGHWIDVWVTDNGHGGATPTPEHGLAGLDERVRGLRGMLVIDSPAGGPTTIGAHVPYVPLAASGTAAGTVPGVV
jgi:signal transduction histidine kinase